MTLIRELISIPEQVQDGDFVLRLTQGITPAEARRTVDDYVVTTQLAEAFDHALGLVASAVADNTSKATFLQGSFGSGKSHFMAMLHLLLGHDPHARAKPQLHAAIAKYGPKLDGRNFLLVPVHFLEARSMEQVIFAGYIDQIERLHPGAALPSVFLGDEIMATDLPNLRAQIGDEKLLAGLNGSVEADEWGDFAATWTADTVDAALAAPATDPRRLELVSAYINAFRPSTPLESATSGRGYLDLDRGLAALSVHAQQLGYSGVVLFLDELILWLASNIGDLSFVQRESQKLTKLVEATAAGRPVPIISFVARQRDLRELVGEHIAGSEVRSFADVLELQQGRFGQIMLAAGNLPQVARQRLLRPIDEEAARTLAGAVDRAFTGRDDVRRMLAGTDADLEMFRTVYPFSPALVTALVDVAEALQRERTALKVMLQLLVNQRDTLELGQFIPVGDLWDVVSARDEPFSAELRKLFERAKRLWSAKLAPALANVNGVTDDTPADHPARVAMAVDARLVKTVLLAALVPKIEPFRALDAAKLAALNWGSITSPIPGNETQIVTSKLRRLAPLVGELQLTGDNPVNPGVGILLADVDVDDIIARGVEAYDNPGARRQKIRELMARALDHRIGDDLRGTLAHEWRGTTRELDVVFGNVRDKEAMSDAALAASADRPKLVIDFPFDDVGRSPDDDLDRLDGWAERHPACTTVCWLPSFLNTAGLAALRRYVAAEELLKLDRLDQHTQHLSANQRVEARQLLEGIRTQLAAQLTDTVLAAYGVTSSVNPWVDPVHSLAYHYRSLDPSLTIAATTEPTLGGALGQVCDQILAGLYPRHPRFDLKVTGAHLRTTWAEVRRALADPDRRVLVETSHRQALRTVVVGLELGTMSESAFTLGDTWRNRLDRHLADAEAQARRLSVDDLRRLIDDDDNGARGLPEPVADLVILTVAAQTDHRLVYRGVSYEAEPPKPLPGDVELVPEVLPSAERWMAASGRASLILGLAACAPRVTGPELVALGARSRAAAQPLVAPATALAAKLDEVYRTWGLPDGDRLSTARATRDLVQTLATADDQAVVETLADFTAATSDTAASRSLATAATVVAALGRANLTLWTAARPDIDVDVAQLLTADEVTTAFEKTATVVEASATAIVTHRSPVAPPPVHQPVTPSPSPGEPPVVSQPTAPSGPAGAPPSIQTPAAPTGRAAVVRSPADLDGALAEIRRAYNELGPLRITWSADTTSDGELQDEPERP